MNNFFASVECAMNPSIKGKPVAVCGSVEDRHGIVLAKNYLAKEYNVKTGDAVWQAKQKCPDLVVVNPHYDLYMRYSRLARNIYNEYTDKVEPFGIDECWLDVTSCKEIDGDGKQIADILRQRIKYELGLTISVGVSFNKIFAKLGSDMKKPDAVTVIKQESFKEQLWPLPADSLLGVGRRTSKALSYMGIETIGQLANCPDSILRKKFGIVGIKLKSYANGLDNSAVTQSDYVYPVKSIGCGLTFKEDIQNNRDAAVAIYKLCEKFGSKLREVKKIAKGISVTIRDNSLLWKEWQTSLPYPCSSPKTIAEQAIKLFISKYSWERPIRSITIRVIRLVSEDEPIQISLFDEIQNEIKNEKLDCTMEILKNRFGNRIIQPAAFMKMNYLPDSVVFSSLPAPQYV
jgi:DNA polymerase-4